jgi:hypothetical protein
VQEELGGKLAGGAAEDLDDAAAARQAAEMAAEEMDLGDDVDASDEVVEPYDRAMSPELIEGNKLAYEDRTLPIVDEEETLRAMVSGRSGCLGVRYPPLTLILERSPSTPLVGSSRQQPLSPGLNVLPPFRKPSTRPPLPISQPKGCTEKRLPRIWTKTKNFSTSTKGCSTRVLTVGRTSSGPENRGSSTGFIPGSNGTSTTRRITSEW